jgi:hypothetical protein
MSTSNGIHMWVWLCRFYNLLYPNGPCMVHLPIFGWYCWNMLINMIKYAIRVSIWDAMTCPKRTKPWFHDGQVARAKSRSSVSTLSCCCKSCRRQCDMLKKCDVVHSNGIGSWLTPIDAHIALGKYLKLSEFVHWPSILSSTCHQFEQHRQMLHIKILKVHICEMI